MLCRLARLAGWSRSPKRASTPTSATAERHPWWGGQRMDAPSAAPSSAVQRLYEEAAQHASSVCHGTPLPSAAVQRLALLMGDIPLEELGFPANSQLDPAVALKQVLQPGSPGSLSPRRSPAGARQEVTYLHIYEDQTLAIGIFCFPEGTTIPLHDHPGMTVMSRVLIGELHVRSYDWTHVSSQSNRPERVQLGSKRDATLVTDRVVAAAAQSAPMVLFPREGGNLHQFTARTPCAVLDVLVPPYCPPAHWDCTYYRELEPHKAQRLGDGTVLQAIDQPTWFSVKHGEYRGFEPNIGSTTGDVSG